MPPITTALSQYQILETICAQISSADTIHVAASCKEHWAYIAKSKPIRKKLLESGVCDGLGIVAQNRVFGPLKHGGVEDRTHECLGVDARPCSDCGAQVCDNCRFHVLYPYESPEGHESDYMADEQDCADDLMNHLPDEVPRIHARKACAIFHGVPSQDYCLQCHPLVTNDENVCLCDLYDHFVGDRWLCLPCFFKEETAAYLNPPTYKIVICEGDGSYATQPLCVCGVDAHDASTMHCVRCNKGVGWYGGFDKIILEQIYFQMGGTYREGGDGDDEDMKYILSQLG